MRFSTTTTTAIAALFTISSAQFTASGTSPSGNAIGHPELGEMMTAGSPFTITWTPTTPADNVSLILLQGPSTNVLPIMTITASTPNSGSYTFNVPSNLAPNTTGYGIQLIDSDGTFQYSPQCGVANAAYTPSASMSASGSASTSATNNYITMTLSTGANYTGPIAASTSTFAYATGNTSVPVLTGTGSMTVPATLKSTVVVTPSAGSTFFSATPSAQATQTAGGAVVHAGLGVVGFVGLVAGLVL